MSSIDPRDIPVALMMTKEVRTVTPELRLDPISGSRRRRSAQSG